MRIAVFSTKPYDKSFFDAANKAYQHEIVYFDVRLQEQTVQLAKGFSAVCCFVNDELSAPLLEQLAKLGVRLIALRCAGYNQVDLVRAKALDITVVRVPSYSPYAVAEHAVALMLTLNRKIHRAYHRVRECDFSLHGLLGFDLHGKTVGIVGTGKIGKIFAKIMHGFGCRLLAYDIAPSEECQRLGVTYVSFDELLKQSHIVSLHCPLTSDTHHLIDKRALKLMPQGSMLINTGRGGLVDCKAVVQVLKNRHLGYLGLDVYEEEAGIFFEDCSDTIIQDDTLARLQTFPNVIITSHQGFFTEEALTNIAHTTLSNITAYEQNKPLENKLC